MAIVPSPRPQRCCRTIGRSTRDLLERVRSLIDDDAREPGTSSGSEVSNLESPASRRKGSPTALLVFGYPKGSRSALVSTERVRTSTSVRGLPDEHSGRSRRPPPFRAHPMARRGTGREGLRSSLVWCILGFSSAFCGRCRQGPGSTLVRCGRGPRHGCPGQRRRDLRQVRGHFYAPACGTRVEPEPAHIWQALSAHVDHRPCVGWASTVVTRDSHPCTTGVARVQVICR